MSNEFIGRLSAVGLGKETTSGTSVSAEVWIPKTAGVLVPEYQEAMDDAGYGVIDEVYDSETTKNMSRITLQGIARDDFIGYLFLGALGSYEAVQCITLPTPSGGTPARGDVVYVGVPASETWIGEIKKIITISAVDYYFVSTTSGTLADADTVTDGVWSATAGVTATAGVSGHFFTRLNSNNHPAFTLYDDDQVGANKSTYSMINNFELSCEVGDYVKFSVEFMGKKMESAGALSPVYTDQNGFLAKYAEVTFADTEAGLNAGTAQCMQNFRLGINKNLIDIQCFGSDDIDSIHNQQLTTEGDFEALYSNTTLLDYVNNSEKKAMRFSAVNTGVTALAGTIYPGMYIDFAKVGFAEWTKTDANNDIVKQTLGFTGQFDNATGMQCEILLLNDNVTGY